MATKQGYEFEMQNKTLGNKSAYNETVRANNKRISTGNIDAVKKLPKGKSAKKTWKKKISK